LLKWSSKQRRRVGLATQALDLSIMKSIHFVLAIALGLVCQEAAATQNGASPLPKVIGMLQQLKQKSEEDGVKQAAEFKKYTQWCHDTERTLKYEIKSEKSDIEDFDATIAKAQSDISVATAKIDEQASSLTEYESSVKAAEGIRAKEKETFAASESELTASISALERASNVLQRKMKGAAFVDVQVDKQDIKVLLNTLSTVIDAASLPLHDRKKLSALMQGTEDDAEDDGFGNLGAPSAKAYQGHSSGITDLLEDLKQKAVSQLKELRKEEANGQHNFDLMKGSLTQEIKVANGEMAEAKETKNVASQVQSQTEGDRAVSTKELNADTKALSDAITDCRITADEFDLSTKGRAEEMTAIDAGIEALGGVKNKQAGYSFLQLGQDHYDFLSILRKVASSQHSTALTQLVGRVSAVMTADSRRGDSSGDPFTKVKNMISGMVAKLEKEAGSEASHKAYCDKATADSKESKEKLAFTMAKQTAQIDKAKAKSASLKDEVARLQEELSAMTKEQGDSQQIRSEQNANYKTSKADLTDGLAGVRTALKVLRDFYSNEKPAELLLQRPTFSHSADKGAGGSVISILELVESDMQKQLSNSEVEESEAAANYKKFTQSNEVNRAIKDETVKHKMTASVTLAKVMSEYNEDLDGQQSEMDAVLAGITTIKGQCDAPAPESYEEKTARRKAEVEGLKEALKSIGDQSLLQVAPRPAAQHPDELKSIQRDLQNSFHMAGNQKVAFLSPHHV